MSRPAATSTQGFSPRQVVLRTAAVVLAVSGSDDASADRTKLVATVQELARRVVNAGLRVTFDGDRYYLTEPVPPGVDLAAPTQLHLGDSYSTDTRGLHVVGTAEGLADLFELVDQVTGRG